MFLKVDAFYQLEILNEAKDLLIAEVSDYIKKIHPDPAYDVIEFKDAILEIFFDGHEINVELDRIPAFLQDKYYFSNIIEYNKLAEPLHFLDLNKPPKSYAARNDEVAKCESYLIAQIIENAILLTFNLEKLSEFQFYTQSGKFLGIVDRIRLSRDAFSGVFTTYDCLIFTDRFKLEKRHVAFLKDAMEVVDEEDYCLNDLSEVLEELETLTNKPFIEAETILSFEKMHDNRVKIPKRPIFYRIPFLAWHQKNKEFIVSEDDISEVIY